MCWHIKYYAISFCYIHMYWNVSTVRQRRLMVTIIAPIDLKYNVSLSWGGNWPTHWNTNITHPILVTVKEATSSKECYETHSAIPSLRIIILLAACTPTAKQLAINHGNHSTRNRQIHNVLYLMWVWGFHAPDPPPSSGSSGSISSGQRLVPPAAWRPPLRSREEQGAESRLLIGWAWCHSKVPFHTGLVLPILQTWQIVANLKRQYCFCVHWLKDIFNPACFTSETPVCCLMTHPLWNV